MQKQTRFQTGIYRHFRTGKLYFLREVVEDFDTHVLRVTSDRLYPVHPGTERPQGVRLGSLQTVVAKDEKSNPIIRFTLIMPLPANKIRLLLPGAEVWTDAGMEMEKYRVHEVSGDQSGIQVELDEPADYISKTRLPLDKFLETFQVGAE